MLIEFDNLPDTSRIWIFQSSKPLDHQSGMQLLQSVHWFINDWTAHQQSLTASAAIRDDFFLVVAVDEQAAGASGCSVDKLFRFVQGFERENGVRLTERQRVVISGEPPRDVSLEEIPDLLASEAMSPETLVYDVTVDSLGAYRQRFVTPVNKSWLSRYLLKA
jgi:hypothetical protein